MSGKPGHDPEMQLHECLNPHCPFSGKPVEADSLTLYRGRIVGFCNPGCRNKFAADPAKFPDAIETFDQLIGEG